MGEVKGKYIHRNIYRDLPALCKSTCVGVVLGGECKGMFSLVFNLWEKEKMVRVLSFVGKKEEKGGCSFCISAFVLLYGNEGRQEWPKTDKTTQKKRNICCSKKLDTEREKIHLVDMFNDLLPSTPAMDFISIFSNKMFTLTRQG